MATNTDIEDIIERAVAHATLAAQQSVHRGGNAGLRRAQELSKLLERLLCVRNDPHAVLCVEKVRSQQDVRAAREDLNHSIDLNPKTESRPSEASCEHTPRISFWQSRN